MDVESYNIIVPSLLHQKFAKEIIKQALQVDIGEGKGYERTICATISTQI